MEYYMYAYSGMEPVTVPYASGRNVNGKFCKPLNRESGKWSVKLEATSAEKKRR